MQHSSSTEVEPSAVTQQSMMIIRPAEDRDFQAIADIYNEAIDHGGITMDDCPHSANDIQTIVEKMTDRELLLVGEIAAEPDRNEHQQHSSHHVIGWGIVKRYSDRPGYHVCCETSIYLTFSQSGKGYGRSLQTALMNEVRKFDYHHIVAKIVASNQNSIRFHQQFGFELVGIQERIGFMRDQWYDVAIMQCLL